MMTNKEAIEFGNLWLEMNEDSKNSNTYNFFQMAVKLLEQESFINKPCVSKGACHEDKVKTLDKIRNEVKALTDGAEPDHVWNVDVFAIIDKYKAESEDIQ